MSAKKRKFTRKQKKLVKGIIAGKTTAQAALEAGYSANQPENAGQSGYQAMKAVESRVRHSMDRHGYTFDELIDKHLGLVIAAKESKFFPFRKMVRFEEAKDKEANVTKPAREETKQVITRIKIVNLQAKATGLDNRLQAPRRLYAEETRL